MKETCWVLAGPTASGKTALSLRLARKYGCEILCMDSMQLYRGMDIGTAKPTREEQSLVRHHMLDVAEPTEAYSVARYQDEAEICIKDIHARGKRALLVGGTGLYLRALRHPMALGDTCGDPAFRREMETIAQEDGGRERLHAMLSKTDLKSAEVIHMNNVRRVIRALEVYHLTGVPFSQQPQNHEEPPFQYRVASLTMDRELLYRRIEQRVDDMLKAGLIDEVQRLLDRGVPTTAQAMMGLGYKELIPYLRGECALEEAIYAIKLGTRHYAKRQLTWMRREEDVCWVDSTSSDAFEQLEQWFTKGEEA